MYLFFDNSSEHANSELGWWEQSMSPLAARYIFHVCLRRWVHNILLVFCEHLVYLKTEDLMPSLMSVTSAKVYLSQPDIFLMFICVDECTACVVIRVLQHLPQHAVAGRDATATSNHGHVAGLPSNPVIQRELCLVASCEQPTSCNPQFVMPVKYKCCQRWWSISRHTWILSELLLGMRETDLSLSPLKRASACGVQLTHAILASCEGSLQYNAHQPEISKYLSIYLSIYLCM